jgi:molybdopterin molybdotransferase
MTGSPMPEGADAVLPAEFVEWADRAAWAHAQVPPGGHVGQPGEDVAAGTTVLAAGRVLRPQDVGLLASIGVRDVPAVARPKVAIVATGNELLPVGSRPAGCRIVDSNSVMLAALVRRDGGVPEPAGIVPDEPEAMLAALRRDADVLVVAGASSVGAEDYMPGLLAEHGTLAIHGIAMRPGSPTGMGGLDGRLVFLLPGNPVSCLCGYDFFAGRAIRALGRRSTGWPYRSVRAPLRRKIASTVGRREYVRVRLDAGQVEPLAVGGSSVLSSTVRADGFVLVPDDSEGYPPGAHVDVYLYD